MKLKSLIWTILIATLLFFTIVYLGIKYEWVNEAKPKYPQNTKIQQEKIGTLLLPETDTGKSAAETGNGTQPELIEEVPVPLHGDQLGSSTLSIEEIVTQCQNIATSVGIPEQQFDQAVLECIDRNSAHLKTEQTIVDERVERIRRQCDLAITQRELLSTEEIKMLVDECVASMQ
ncbi:MAG: hypothetical protein CSB47_04860 [Proteobacteria bacterium]|nr:MAG: hypothetical protein CSB47_04860 [Pseudomonadota bacterium]